MRSDQTNNWPSDSSTGYEFAKEDGNSPRYHFAKDIEPETTPYVTSQVIKRPSDYSAGYEFAKDDENLPAYHFAVDVTDEEAHGYTTVNHNDNLYETLSPEVTPEIKYDKLNFFENETRQKNTKKHAKASCD